MLPCLAVLTAHAEPDFSTTRGLIEAPFSLTLSPTQGGTVYYSRDGSPPDQPVTGPLSIAATALISAREVYTDGSASSTITHSYIFPLHAMQAPEMHAGIVNDAVYGPIIEETLYALPTVSLVAADTLSTTEQEVSVEWLDPEGGEAHIRCGARDVGGHSLNYDKNNIRLNFRSAYGAGKLSLDLFADFATGVPPADTHDALNLRSGSHDSVFYLGEAGQYARNRWMDESQLEMGHIAPHGRYAHLYVDGSYTGLYHVRERFDAGLLAEYLGGDEDDYEAVNGGSAVDGSGAAWSAIVAASSDFEAFSELVDVDNYLDYMILNFYAGNDWDWNPSQNWMAAGPALGGSGAGKYIFHASDNDICLYYSADINILHEVGPSNTFDNLSRESHPDFWARFADRAALLLHGVLAPDAAAARYTAITDQIEDAVVAESARWGEGSWERDVDWDEERHRLLEEYFPARTDILLQQFRDAGWYHLDRPEVSHPAGMIEGDLTVSVPAAYSAQLLLTLDGTDPRLPGGDVSDAAEVYEGSATLTLSRSAMLSARLYQPGSGVWGPLLTGLYEVDAPSAMVLNEWNAVAEDATLRDDGEDTTLGRAVGNGGDWIELLVIEDGLDIRGWTLEMTDRTGPVGVLSFTDAALLSDLAAGTLITVSAELAEDAAYDPAQGDWRFHLRAAEGGTGAYISAADFSVSHREWTLTIRDAEGFVVAGPTGEGVAPQDGISSREVGLLAATPDDDLRRTSADYTDGALSSFGAPNVWDGGVQDLSALRGETGSVVDIHHEDTAADDGPEDTGVAVTEPTGPATTGSGGCGGKGALLVGLGGLLALRRRREVAAVVLLSCQPVDSEPVVDSAATDDTATLPVDSGDSSAAIDQDGDGFTAQDCDDLDSTIHPDAPEVCDGVDNDCDGLTDSDDDSLTDGLPFFEDADGDGHGGTLVTACTAEGLALSGDDCDDTDSTIHPGAAEACDGIDQDCDGSAEDGQGLTEDCAADSCLAILSDDPSAADGLWWLALPEGGAGQVYCDMTTDGGGWTLGFLRNSASTGSQGNFGAGDVSTEALAVSPEEASSTGAAHLGWLDLNSLEFAALQLAAYASGSETYRSDTIDAADLRIAFGDDGWLLYGAGGYYWCGGDAAYTDSGQGAVNNPAGATADCRGHASLGSGWDFSDSLSANAGLTLCGADGSSFLQASFGGTRIYYGTPGGAQAIWVR